MSATAEVHLWGTAVGYVALDEGEEYARFEYDPAFLGSGIELAPLTMPLSSRVYSFPQLAIGTFHGLPGLLADSLPDKFGNAVIASWLRSQGRNSEDLNAVERLCYTGSRGMGALEYVPSIGPLANDGEVLQARELVELATRILSQRDSLSFSAEEHAMEQIIKVGTSAGGARAKAVVAWNEKTGEVRSGQAQSQSGFGQWVMKFDGVRGNGDKEGEDAPCYTVIEYAYSLMARFAGIDMPEMRLFDEGGRRHFLARRFDRNVETGDKIHMQSLGALAHFDFNEPRVHGYEQAVDVARRIGLGQVEVEEIFRRMVFNVVGRNHDDHVKNMSFLMDRSGTWALAPAYDVTYAYNPQGAWTSRHQMTINGKSDSITLDDCLTAARYMSIKQSKARSIIADVLDAREHWMSFADEANLAEDTACAIDSQLVKL